MDVKISMSLLRDVAAKRPEFWNEITCLGQIEGDCVRISQDAFQDLNVRHFGSVAPGNIVHTLVAPIARVVGFEDCSGCAERQLRMNA